jgi:hypothetical protein
MTHFDRVEAFLASLGGESVDARFPRLEGKRADYLLSDRRVIVELKSLVDDRTAPVEKVLLKHFARPGEVVPIYYGTHDLQAIIARRPNADKINADLYRAIMSSVEDAFEGANRQIRAMRETFALPDAHGVVVFVIEDVYFFDPEKLQHKIGNLFAKNESAGGPPRYPDVDLVFIPTAAHVYVTNEGWVRLPVMCFAPPTTPRRERLQELADYLCEQWAAFTGLPLVRATPEELAGMTLRSGMRLGTVSSAGRSRRAPT